MRKSFKKYIDWISLVVSCLSMMLMFLTPDPLISKVLLFAAGLVGLGYLGYAAFLWFFKRVDFDWHLINGHFLRKVIVLVISMPSTITMIMTCISTCSPESKDAFKYKKNFHKEGENRMHPNICAYNHLDKVDFEAKGYDTYLNSMIPTIKLLVDDRIELRNSENNNA